MFLKFSLSKAYEISAMKLGYPGQHAKRLHIFAKINNKTAILIICLHYNFLHSSSVSRYAHIL